MALLAVHLGLAVWGGIRNSVTFDENYHVPAGVMIAARGEMRISSVNPPLVKALCGAAALAAGAKLPSSAALANGEQGVVGESFMRMNADRYQRVYIAARLVVTVLSLFLGLLVWRVARRLYGARGGVLALAFYACAPEALAHAGLATMDLATGLTWLASVYAFWMFSRTGRWIWWCGAAIAVSCAFLVRYSAFLLGPTLVAVAVLSMVQHRARRPLRLWMGLLLLIPAILFALQMGFLWHTTLDPLARWQFGSHLFQSLRAAAPWLRLPVPDVYVGGLDRELMDTQTGVTPTFLFGRVIDHRVWYYFPLAALFKWPVGFLGALGLRVLGPTTPRDRRKSAILVLTAGLYLAAVMFVVSLNAGIRYLFPVLPVLCVWLGGFARQSGWMRGREPRRWGPRIAVALVLLQGVETGLAAPWYLSFFNWPSGGPGGGYRLLNDSNVDWGQGLIALRDELTRRGIKRVHLAYHGTTDPAVYGIDYVPYLGGPPGPESDWLAVSSYYFVGMSQQMMTSTGRTPRLKIDFGPLRSVPPSARPANCIYLFRIR